MRKAQTQIVSVIIIVGIAAATLATVVPWATLTIQKKKDAKSVNDIYDFFQSLDADIREIAKNGGEKSLKINVPGKLTISPDSNSIVFLFSSKVSNVGGEDWIPLNTVNINEIGILGVDKPSVIFAKATENANFLEIEYKLWYRTLNDTSLNKAYIIDLKTSDGQDQSTTSGYMRIRKLGSTELDNLITTEVNIII